MTIYGIYNKTTKKLMIRSDGPYSSGQYAWLATCKNATEAKREFFHEHNYWSKKTKLVWEGSYED